jgi:hypothetical protein
MGAERATAAELERLEADGWIVLHDRRAPDGGNIDHLAIGPPGVAVLDTKAWADPVTITAERRLVHSKYDSTDELARLSWLVDCVRLLLGRDGVSASARGYLVLAGEADRARRSEDLGKQSRDLAPDLVEAIAASLAAELPAATDPSPAAAVPVGSDPLAGIAPSPMFEKVHRFYYLSPWSKGGHKRMYLNDRHGTSLGYTDLNTHAVEITCGADDRRIAETLLAAVEQSGIKVAPGDVPKVPTTLFGGRLLSRLASRHASVLVGHEWRAYGKHRLYGMLLDPKVATSELGWVDLRTGERHPSADAPGPGDQAAPDVYLQYLLHHRPTRRGSAQA